MSAANQATGAASTAAAPTAPAISPAREIQGGNTRKSFEKIGEITIEGRNDAGQAAITIADQIVWAATDVTGPTPMKSRPWRARVGGVLLNVDIGSGQPYA